MADANPLPSSSHGSNRELIPNPWRKRLEHGLLSVYASTRPTPSNMFDPNWREKLPAETAALETAFRRGPQPRMVPPIPPYEHLVDTRRARLTADMYGHLKLYSVCLECKCIDATADEFNNNIFVFSSEYIQPYHEMEFVEVRGVPLPQPGTGDYRVDQYPITFWFPDDETLANVARRLRGLQLKCEQEPGGSRIMTEDPDGWPVVLRVRPDNWEKLGQRDPRPQLYGGPPPGIPYQW